MTKGIQNKRPAGATQAVAQDLVVGVLVAAGVRAEALRLEMEMEDQLPSLSEEDSAGGNQVLPVMEIK